MPGSFTRRLPLPGVPVALILTAPLWALTALERPTGERHLILRAMVVVGILLVAACDDDSPTGPVDPTQIEFAAELGVDLDQMTRTSSGLYLLDELGGDGEMAQPGSRVTVHYTGWLPDGRKFDSSLDRGEPFIVDVLGAGQVIQGWDEGLVGMRAGGRRLLVIPPQLAYGPSPILGRSWATLVFRVDLLSVGS